MLIAAVSSRLQPGRAILAPGTAGAGGGEPAPGTIAAAPRHGRRGMIRPMPAPPPAPITPRLAAVWGAFCLLMILVGLQERWYAGQPLWPWPVFYELSSLAVATGVAAWRWRASSLEDPWLARPAMWFWRVLRWTPPIALLFVALLYGLRHAVRAAFGLDYAHQPWAEVLAYEGLKFSVFYGLFAGITFALRSHQALAAERLRAERLERLTTEARLAQLTQQMQPHFLHNALNTIAALVHDDPDAADAALLHLSRLLRAATAAARRPLHPLADELALAQSYAALMQQRFGAQRVQLQWETDAAPAVDVPALSLQPLLENAFVHAVEPRAARTTVSIGVRRDGDRVVFCVADDGDGDGAGDGDSLRFATAPGRGSGVGLANLRERLRALYGEAASLQLRPRDGGGHVARMELPAHG
jgi:signal transduction histidine kinase